MRMSLNLLAIEVKNMADFLSDVTKLLQILTQHKGKIDRDTATQLVEILDRGIKPLYDLVEELHTLSLVITDPSSEIQQ
jgi:hypothetical protein